MRQPPELFPPFANLLDPPNLAAAVTDLVAAFVVLASASADLASASADLVSASADLASASADLRPRHGRRGCLRGRPTTSLQVLLW